jgi:hypothetical protein
LWPGTCLSCVPDRYTINRDQYLAQGGSGKPWDTNDFTCGNATNNRGDLFRRYFLHRVCDQILEERLTGDIAELGVYKGKHSPPPGSIDRPAASPSPGSLNPRPSGDTDAPDRGVSATAIEMLVNQPRTNRQ